LGRGDGMLRPSEHGTPALARAVAVGDSEYDACMVGYAGIGVAFYPTSEHCGLPPTGSSRPAT